MARSLLFDAAMLLRNYVASLALVASAALASCGGVASSSSDCPPVPIHCTSGCRYGVVGSDAPTCVNGQWMCPSPGPVCIDGGSSVDASGDANADATDAPADVVVVFDAATVACGPRLVCTSTTQFCQESSGGPPPPPDAGSGIGYGCEPYPAACATNRTCACLRANGACGGGLVSCQESGAGITVECAFP